MNKAANLQDLLLNQARKDNIPVTVFLTSGFQMKGMLRGFDAYVIMLDTDGKQQMIYKHAISTIVPFRTIKLSVGAEAE
ncbi:MAG: RNA chaperone Hfq [Clostridiales bacterium]|jgi:host factor-I protein|nr:RNA chaperone Hfq [Clostridiales bacterium]